MSPILRKFAQSVDAVIESRADVDLDGARPQSGFFEKKLAALHDMVANPAFSISDLPAYLDAIRNSSGIGIDDRELLLEKVLVLMAKLKDTTLSKKIQEAVINLLYRDLPHPPSGYLKLPPSVAPTTPSSVPYAYRTADGSYYNPLAPAMGMAGTPYARSVPSKRTLPNDSLPDPDLVFDTLLKRDKFVPHPGGMSALFFAFADLVIHSIFKTNPRDWTINDASSYLDLSVLYGHNDKEVDAIRRKDGTGRLWNDVFADSRLIHMPPASCALLVLMSRNHNYVAEKVLDINEKGKYTKTFKDEKERLAQDDEIFHRARLVNCGYFMHIILGDYVGAILGLVRDCSDWRLDPMMTMRKINHEFVPVGEGNVVSIEFNLLYRWHATLSDEDTQWTEQMFNTLFDGKDSKEVTIDDFKEQAHKKLIHKIDQVREWTFNGLKRGSDGRFNDDDLARIIQNSTEYRAGAYKARGIPEALRIIEVMGIKQARSWGTCSLNEFRRFMNLKPYDSFKDWNPEPKIYNAAQALYRDIENLELHVGLQAEQTKEPGDGAGLCPGYTISRAILADAVCLTRGDRFFTVDFTPNALTSWGYQDCQYDKADGSFGGLLTKLLLRTLPNHYARGSAYAHFPFMVPSFLEKEWTQKHPELVGKYTWTRPRKQSKIVPIGDYEAVKRVVNDGSFVAAYDTRLLTAAKPVLDKSTFRRTMSLRGKRPVSAFIKEADKMLITGRDEINKVILESPVALANYFSSKTKELIKAAKFTNVEGTVAYVDIVRDVINLLPVHWISQQVAGLPLKSASSPSGTLREQELYDMFTDIAEYVYLNFNPENDWRLRESTQKHGEEITGFIKGHVDSLKGWTFSFSEAKNHIGLANDGHEFLGKVVTALRSRNQTSGWEIATQVFAAVVPTAALYSAALSQIVSFFLDERNAAARTKVLELSKSKEAGASADLLPYIREALRLNPAIPGFYRTAVKEVVLGPQNVLATEAVYASLWSANRDATVFGPDPEVPVYHRQSGEAILGLANTGLSSEKFLATTVGPVLSEILSLKEIEKAAKRSGRFNEFQDSWHGYPRNQYIDAQGAVSQFPDSLIIQYKTSA